MLSSRISPVKTFIGVKGWLWGHHRVGVGVWTAILTSFGLCGLSIGLGQFVGLPMMGSCSAIAGLPTLIVATAAYAGGLFGFLQAVTIFAVQLRTQQDTSALSLTPLLARRYHTFYVLGLIAGVTMANLFASFAVPILPVADKHLAALTWVNFVFVPLVTVLALRYLTLIIAEAGQQGMSVALPVLRGALQVQALEDVKMVRLVDRYGSLLDEVGVEFSFFIDRPFANGAGGILKIPLHRKGEIVDVDCFRLREIGSIARQLPGSPKLHLTALVGRLVGRKNGAIIVWDKAMEDMPDENDVRVMKIAKVMQKAFIINRKVEQ
jgi:hypothetical protein